MPDQMGSLAATDSYPLDEQQVAQDAFAAAAARTQRQVSALPEPGTSPLGQAVQRFVSQPSWLEKAQAESDRNAAALQQGGPQAMLALDPSQAIDLAGGFGGTTHVIKPLITKVSPSMYEDALSGVKQRISVGDLNAGRKFTSEASPFELSRPEDIPVGSHVLSLHGDRSGVGTLSEMFGHPVGEHQIHGGADFINTQSPGAVWASEPAVSSAYQNKIDWLHNTTGKDVYGLYGPMGVRSIDFQPAVSKLALQGVGENQGQLSKSAIEAFDKDMRRQWGGPTPTDPKKKIDWPAAPDWPGITKTGAATKYLADTTGGLRNKFGKLLDKGEMMDEGFPNMSVIRHGFTSPEMENLPNYVYGRRVAKLDANPAAGGIEHPAFGKNIGGESMGGWGYATPREVAFEDVVKNLQLQNKPVKEWDYYFSGRMPKTIPYQQEVTRRWIDANSAFGDQVNRMGELAAFDKFSREGLKF